MKAHDLDLHAPEYVAVLAALELGVAAQVPTVLTAEHAGVLLERINYLQGFVIHKLLEETEAEIAEAGG